MPSGRSVRFAPAVSSPSRSSGSVAQNLKKLNHECRLCKGYALNHNHEDNPVCSHCVKCPCQVGRRAGNNIVRKQSFKECLDDSFGAGTDLDKDWLETLDITPFVDQFSTGSRPSRMDCLQMITVLCDVFTKVESYICFLKFKGEKSQMILDACQMLLDLCILPNKVAGQIITATQRLVARARQFPARLIFEGNIFIDEHTSYSGGFADVYEAESATNREKLCLKVLRLNAVNSRAAFKLFAKEIILWSQLSHPNVMPFYGITSFYSEVAIVLPWAMKGNLGKCLDLEELCEHRILLIADITSGLEYLHSNELVHGDLKAANVLVDESWRAYITDFGLSNVENPSILDWATESSIASKGGTPRYQAPELHEIENDESTGHPAVIHNTFESDVYALGCIFYEVFTGRVPFFETPGDCTVVYHIMQGKTPSRPDSQSSPWLTDTIWSIVKSCWKFDPAERPSAFTLRSRIEPLKPLDGRLPAQWPLDAHKHFRTVQTARNKPGFTFLDLDQALHDAFGKDQENSPSSTPEVSIGTRL